MVNNNNKKLKIGLIVATLLMVSLGICTLLLYKKGEQIRVELTNEKSSILKDLNSMASKYDQAISESNTAKDNLVQARNRITGLIDSLETSESNLKSLLRYRNKYMQLQEEMEVLLSINDSLQVENTTLSVELDSTRVRLKASTVNNDSLLVQNSELTELVASGSVLATVNLSGQGVIVRNSGKLIPTERSKRSDKIKICFTIAKNPLVNSGDKKLYIQVIDPKNNVLGQNNLVLFDNKELYYSLICNFNYEKENLTICEYLEPTRDDRFDKGLYIINVFDNRNKVSTSTFELK